MSRDFHDATTCDVILANLSIPHDKPSLGTVMELAWGFQNQKLVVAIDSEKHNYRVHPMIREAVGFWAKDMDEALAIIERLLFA